MKTILIIAQSLAWLFLAGQCVAHGAQITFTWEIKADEQITRTDVFRINKNGERVFVGTSDGTSLTAELPPGTYTFTAASQNATGWGPFADPITVTVTAPPLTLPTKPTKFKATVK